MKWSSLLIRVLTFITIFSLVVALPSPNLALAQKDEPTSTATPTATPSLAPSPECSLYPIALSAQPLIDANIGDALPDILNGSQPGNFGWLTWSGNPSEQALVTSLTPPGKSDTYINPSDSTDHVLSVGDWVSGSPGVSNSSAVRQALDMLKTADIDVPVWDATTGEGKNTQYHISDFARVRIVDYQLAKENQISVIFLGYSCGSGTPTPTPTSTPTDTPTETPTPTETRTPTLTPTDTITPTPTETFTPTFTHTPTATDTPTDTSTPTPTDTPTSTFTATYTPTATFKSPQSATPTFHT